MQANVLVITFARPLIREDNVPGRSENAGSVWRSSVGDFEGHCNRNWVLVKPFTLASRFGKYTKLLIFMLS